MTSAEDAQFAWPHLTLTTILPNYSPTSFRALLRGDGLQNTVSGRLSARVTFRDSLPASPNGRGGHCKRRADTFWMAFSLLEDPHGSSPSRKAPFTEEPAPKSAAGLPGEDPYEIDSSGMCELPSELAKRLLAQAHRVSACSGRHQLRLRRDINGKLLPRLARCPDVDPDNSRLLVSDDEGGRWSVKSAAPPDTLSDATTRDTTVGIEDECEWCGEIELPIPQPWAMPRIARRPQAIAS